MVTIWPGYYVICDWANHVSTKNCQFFVFALSQLSINYHHNKMFTTSTEFNRLSSAIYKSRILHSELKVFTRIIYVCMVDFHRPSHIHFLPLSQPTELFWLKNSENATNCHTHISVMLK